jgi:hypothetical protein
MPTLGVVEGVPLPLPVGVRLREGEGQALAAADAEGRLEGEAPSEGAGSEGAGEAEARELTEGHAVSEREGGGTPEGLAAAVALPPLLARGERDRLPVGSAVADALPLREAEAEARGEAEAEGEAVAEGEAHALPE